MDKAQCTGTSLGPQKDLDKRHISAYSSVMRRKPDQLIPIEVSILEAALALDKHGTKAFHGYALAKVLKTETKRRTLTAYGTLYRALHRLERAGLVESFWEDPAHSELDGRPRRRLYRVTALAQIALARARAEQRSGGKIGALKEGLEAQ